jgi:hypothetical protein
MTEKANKLAMPRLPPLPARFVRLLLALTVSVGVSLAPYLGRINIPGFSTLLKTFPDVLQDIAIPSSTFLMAVIASCIEFFGANAISRRAARKTFVALALAAIVSVFLFVALHLMSVTVVEFGGGKGHTAFVTGFSERGESCLCAPGEKDCVQCNPKWAPARCIENISLNPSSVQTCFGYTNVRTASIVLVCAYLELTSLLAAMVGILTVIKRP